MNAERLPLTRAEIALMRQIGPTQPTHLGMVRRSAQILALANSDEKNAMCCARKAFAFRTTAQNPRPNRQKPAQLIYLETLPPSRIL